MLFFIIITFLILILFIPIPLKLKLHYSKDRYYIKFYNINIISNDDGMIKKFLEKKKEKEKNIKDSKLKDYMDIDSNEKNLKPLIKNLYFILKRNKFKPSIKFSSDIIYSLGDASKTAIFLGLFYNINPIFLYLFSILFKVKLLKNNLNPIFKDEILFEFTISSIITFNLAQIIYIFFIIYKSIRKNRR
ncbi:MAG: DUF2953 domain-containing protein [Clostridium celatum]|nr:DUF2953 domain-containing protein [Clostridium celatum]MDU4980375.1 DUF2953 domain-containing protein [Clostridium celatum]